jgi:hypothetical protein
MIYLQKLIVTTFCLSLLIISFSCKDDEIACTEQFVTIGLEITGADLDDHFTIRQSNADTIRIGSVFGDFYPVLDDSYQTELENEEEQFSFIGIIADTITVSESFIIAADECHVMKISGVDKVEL